MTLEELLLYWASHLLDQCIPVDGSQDGANTLMQAGKILSIVTARNDTDHRDDTQKWVSKHFPDIFDDRIFFANHLRDGHASKSSFCHQHHITLMIDDGLHNAIDLAENGIACILLDRPWNRNDEVNHQLIYRVKNWQEIIDNLSSN